MAGRGSVNKVILIGNLGADPETRYTPSNMAITKIRIATTEVRRNRDSGDSQELTEWHRVTLFGRLGEIAAQYLRKGAKVYIEGRLRTSKWQGQDGQDRYTTEVIADEMTMLDSRGGGGGGGGAEVPLDGPGGSQPERSGGGGVGPRPTGEPDFDDDIPF
jgi:single-strand DNA-binding protein